MVRCDPVNGVQNKFVRRIEGLTVRGWYDLSGFRADADLLLWAHAKREAVANTKRKGSGDGRSTTVPM